MDEATSRPFYAQAVDAGINFFDTANVYSAGTSEEFLGRALRDLGVNRDEVVIATKVNGPMRKGPNSVGLSRKAILAEVDHSLRRLGTDYIDLYQIHRLDRGTPMEEVLEALDDVVRAGKVRYLGASSMWAWEFAKMLHIADTHGWTRFVSMQNYYNLRTARRSGRCSRCAATGHRSDPVEPARARSPGRDRGTRRPSAPSHDTFGGQPVHRGGRPRGRRAGSSRSRPSGACRWPRWRPHGCCRSRASPRRSSAPPSLTTSPDAVAAVELTLSDEEIARLEAPYAPHPVAGF